MTDQNLLLQKELLSDEGLTDNPTKLDDVSEDDEQGLSPELAVNTAEELDQDDVPIKDNSNFRNLALDSGYTTDQLNEKFGFMNTTDQIFEKKNYSFEEFQGIKKQVVNDLGPDSSTGSRRATIARVLVEKARSKYPELTYEGLKLGDSPFFNRRFMVQGKPLRIFKDIDPAERKLNDKEIIRLFTNVKDATFTGGVIHDFLPGLSANLGVWQGAKFAARTGNPYVTLGAGVIGGITGYMLADEVQEMVFNPDPVSVDDTAFEMGRTTSLIGTGVFFPWLMPAKINFGGAAVLENMAKGAPGRWKVQIRAFLENVLQTAKKEATEKPIQTLYKELGVVGGATVLAGAAQEGDPYGPVTRIFSEVGGGVFGYTSAALTSAIRNLGDAAFLSINKAGLIERELEELTAIKGPDFDKTNPIEYAEELQKIESKVDFMLKEEGLWGKRVGSLAKGVWPSGKRHYKAFRTKRLRQAFAMLYKERKNYEIELAGENLKRSDILEIEKKYEKEIFPALIDKIEVEVKAAKLKQSKTDEDIVSPSLASAADDDFFKILEKRFTPDNIFPQTQRDFDAYKTLIQAFTLMGKTEGDYTYFQEAARLKKQLVLAHLKDNTARETKLLMDALKKVHPEGIGEGASLELAEGLRKIISKQLEFSYTIENKIWNDLRSIGADYEVPIPTKEDGTSNPLELNIMKILYGTEDATDPNSRVIVDDFVGDLEGNLDANDKILGQTNAYRLIRAWGDSLGLDPKGKKGKKEVGSSDELDLLDEQVSNQIQNIQKRIKSLDGSNEEAFRVNPEKGELDHVRPFLEENVFTDSITVVELEIAKVTSALDNILERVKAGDEAAKLGGDPEYNVIPGMKREIKVLERHLKKLNLQKEIDDITKTREAALQQPVLGAYRSVLEEIGALEKDFSVPEGSVLKFENLANIRSVATTEKRMAEAKGDRVTVGKLRVIINAIDADLERIYEVDGVDAAYLEHYGMAKAFTAARANYKNQTFVGQLTKKTVEGADLIDDTQMFNKLFSGSYDTNYKRNEDILGLHDLILKNIGENVPDSVKQSDEFIKAMKDAQTHGADTQTQLSSMLRLQAFQKGGPLLDDFYKRDESGAVVINFNAVKNWMNANSSPDKRGLMDLFPLVKEDLLDYGRAYTLFEGANKRIAAQQKRIDGNKDFAALLGVESPHIVIREIMNSKTPQKGLQELAQMIRDVEAKGVVVDQEKIYRAKHGLFTAILDYAIDSGRGSRGIEDWDPEIAYNLLFERPRKVGGRAKIVTEGTKGYESAEDFTLNKFIRDNDLIFDDLVEKEVEGGATELVSSNGATWRNRTKDKMDSLEKYLKTMVRLKKAIKNKDKKEILEIESYFGAQSVFSELYLSLAGSKIGTTLLGVFPGQTGTGGIIAAGKGSKFMNKLLDTMPKELKLNALVELLQRPDLFVEQSIGALDPKTGKLTASAELGVFSKIYSFLIDKGFATPARVLQKSLRSIPREIERKREQKSFDKRVQPVSLAPPKQDTWYAARGTAPTAPTAPPPQPPPPPTGTANPNQRSMYANLFPNDFASGMINPQGGIKSLLG